MINLCVNCGISTDRNSIGKRVLNDANILTVIREWLSPQRVKSKDIICQACWDLAGESPTGGKRRFGYQNVCIHCGRLLAARANHRLHTETSRGTRICNIVGEWISPRLVGSTSRICHSCWMAADQAASRPGTAQSPPQDDNPKTPTRNENENDQDASILLPLFKRPKETDNKCFIKACRNRERNRVPKDSRKMLFKQYKYYVPEDSRLCDRHLDILVGATEIIKSLNKNCSQRFPVTHVLDMISLH